MGTKQPNPQQPELRRSDETVLNPDSIHGGRGVTDEKGNTGPMPEENEPGHRPEHEQDKPEVPPAQRHQR